jgi:prevent-host-death family protein
MPPHKEPEADIENISMETLRKHLSDIINITAFGQRIYIISRNNKRLVAIISLELLEVLLRESLDNDGVS